MTNPIPVLRWIIRIAGIVALGMGLAFWGGTGYALLSAHQGLGYLVTAALLLMAVLGFGRGVAPGLLGLALVWGLVVPAIGVLQLRLLPGNLHWIIQVFHLLLGVGAVALSEIIAGRALKGRTAAA
ncbi:hypothetical protein ACFP9V_23340 [Deinococcus radiopugnans]|uniref:Uncharacterized protein n=1 Tax=Deinococcus radiopugnans ATCC 19172 TaxID=585398 RepID=A0A5C4XME5_9DEIO|nr:hypothetical protein [Deinococcus radiopugnans]MBB6018775.1 hypothetical protein [Deinococcus radiopugnans ATCC 19172]TNM64706.1 hypothetical protein FHR04_19545 [Deinococcus radiopugnans ATCC 19172]